MRRELWITMLALVGWCLAAGLYFGTHAFNQDTPPSPPRPATTRAPAATEPPAPKSLAFMEWSPARAQGDLLPDPTGRGFDAHLSGSARILPNAAGIPAISFDGTGDNGIWRGQPQNCGLSIDKPLRQAFQTLSVEAWVRKQRAGWMPVLYRDKWDEESGFGLYMEWSEGKAVFGHYGNESGVQSAHEVQDGTWHHIVGTLGPTGDGRYRYRIYVDGQPDGEQVGPWAVSQAPPAAGILVVACPNSSGAEQPFKGDLGPLALFDTEFSPDQIKARYETQKPH